MTIIDTIGHNAPDIMEEIVNYAKIERDILLEIHPVFMQSLERKHKLYFDGYENGPQTTYVAYADQVFSLNYVPNTCFRSLILFFFFFFIRP
jgi:hypothetical protein